MRSAICLSVIDSARADSTAVATRASDNARGRPPLCPLSKPHRPLSFQECAQLVVHRLVAHLELNGDLMNPPSAGKLQQTQPTGPKVLIRMLARQLLQGLLLRFSQFNGTFHGQAGGQDEIASQTRHSEIRLLDTLMIALTIIPFIKKF